MMHLLSLFVFTILSSSIPSSAFQLQQSLFQRRCPILSDAEADSILAERRAEGGDPPSVSRRIAMGATASLVTAIGWSLFADSASSEGMYRPAVRPTAYRVDSTIPPTLLPLTARDELSILEGLSKGSGTDKEAIVVDTVNLNNMLNKAVFGTATAASSLFSAKKKDRQTGPSFVCLGVPTQTTGPDIELAGNILSQLFNRRKGSAITAVGVHFMPYNVQPALDAYVRKDIDYPTLMSTLEKGGVQTSDVELYKPILDLCRARSIDLLAISPEQQDIRTVRSAGLQNVDPERRRQYVPDPNGFISLTQDPVYQLYTDRSLLKDYRRANDSSEDAANFFSERILVHEAAASAVGQYVSTRPENALVAILAPIQDVRFLNGINGRIPRVCNYFLGERKSNIQIDNNAVTTILLNPTALETLSKSRYLRLEIGTSPDTLDFQCKVADYLWFSQIPKVNLLPRLMN